MLQPSIFFDFANAHYLDPRFRFSRASAASYCDRLGVLRYRPAGTPRFWTLPGDGSPGGLLLEGPSTNLLLWSEDFTNVAWTATAATVTVNAATAPDGNATADNVASTGPTASIGQPVNFTVNNSLGYSVFAKAGASNFLSLSLNDGQNVVSAWFDLSAGAVGTTLLGSGTLTYQWATIQAWGNGWYRCGLQAAANTITGVTASMSPCAANGFAPASGNSAYLWGAMLTQEGTTTTDQKLTAYIPTTSAAATRAAENFPLPYANIDPSAFNQNEGTYFADFLIPSGTFKAFNTPGVGFVTAGGTDWVQTGLQIGRSGLGRLPLTLALQTSIGTSSVYQTTATVYPNFAYDVPIKFATRFSRTKLVGICANGGAIAESTIVPPQYPGLPTNFMVSPCFGNYSTITASAAFIARRFAYFPRYLSADQMQQLTA